MFHKSVLNYLSLLSKGLKKAFITLLNFLTLLSKIVKKKDLQIYPLNHLSLLS